MVGQLSCCVRNNRVHTYETNSSYTWATCLSNPVSTTKRADRVGWFIYNGRYHKLYWDSKSCFRKKRSCQISKSIYEIWGNFNIHEVWDISRKWLQVSDKQRSFRVFFGLYQNGEKIIEFYSSLTVSQLVVPP